MAVPVPSISCCVLNHHNLLYQIQNALALNWDMCCHLALCLRLLPFHCYHIKPPSCRNHCMTTIGAYNIHLAWYSGKFLRILSNILDWTSTRRSTVLSQQRLYHCSFSAAVCVGLWLRIRTRRLGAVTRDAFGAFRSVGADELTSVLSNFLSASAKIMS